MYGVISDEEFRHIDIGDKIRIVSEWNINSKQNHQGFMDKYLSKILTVTGLHGSFVTTCAKDGGCTWCFNRFCISEINPSDDENLQDCNLDVMYMMA